MKNAGGEIAIFFIVVVFFYFLPTFIVIFNSNRAHRPATILVNLFLGWSVIGWFVALFLSLQTNLIRVEVVNEEGKNI